MKNEVVDISEELTLKLSKYLTCDPVLASTCPQIDSHSCSVEHENFNTPNLLMKGDSTGTINDISIIYKYNL